MRMGNLQRTKNPITSPLVTSRERAVFPAVFFSSLRYGCIGSCGVPVFFAAVGAKLVLNAQERLFGVGRFVFFELEGVPAFEAFPSHNAGIDKVVGDQGFHSVLDYDFIPMLEANNSLPCLIMYGDK